MFLIAINYYAVVAAAVASFVIGWLWYGPLFGKTWKPLEGLTDEDLRKMPLSPMQAMALGFLSSLVMAYVLAYFVGLLFVVDAMGALQLAFWIWLGFFVTTQSGSVLWQGKPVNLFLLNIAYYFVSLSAMALILVYWPY